jgi:hypothetical protein
MLGEGCVADAILDRIIHNSYELLISSDSMRQKNSFKRKTPEYPQAAYWRIFLSLAK